jgi:hypothetical protein
MRKQFFGDDASTDRAPRENRHRLADKLER